MAFCMRGVNPEHYRDHFKSGIYACAECGNELFSSLSKYTHHTPWPAFTETVREDSVSKTPEPGRPKAIKVSCGKCGAGLGHEFLEDRDDGGSRF
ncbi:Hypothetical predicted protein [Cloeon dipterum]|uniref:peptide-methionine (R)-S-oxide reductase n=1 Tax=Cloeon dipterum TaxID=197152 RepID=A0A8S1CDI5_9INSE|nr:Hypothetical predicted protein [Cloeon dipterum]